MGLGLPLGLGVSFFARQKGTAALPAIRGWEDTSLTMTVLRLLSSVSSSAEGNWLPKRNLTPWGKEAPGSQETGR